MEEPEPLLIPPEEETAMVAQAPGLFLLQTSGGLPPALWSKEQFAAQIRGLIPTLRGLCLSLTHNRNEAEDLLQTSLMKAFVHRKSFQGRSPLAGWLYGIMRHEFEEQVRQRARRRALLSCELEREGGAWIGETTPGRSPEEQVDQAEYRARLRACIERLPELYREVVMLCDLEEHSHEQVAARLALPLGTVKSRHARGLARLREALQGGPGGTPGPTG
jgi:RNA polymerase sigma-70 factor (ECF subfamily)